MKAAIRSVVKPVSASALTTIAGLLALLFMSLRIGFDIGIVLMKGIVISAPTSVTLVLILLCGVLQTGNNYLFSDTKTGNEEISRGFGNNNSVAVIYPDSGNGYKNEQALADILATYRKKDGETVLSSYTAYTNTVRALYDTQKLY